jgi:hypothetical protein
MSKRQFTRLRLVTGDYLEIGTRLRQDGTADFAPAPMAPIEGVIQKMVECDSGIFLYIKTDTGEVKLMHVRSFLPNGIPMNDHGICLTILQRAPQQLEIRV